MCFRGRGCLPLVFLASAHHVIFLFSYSSLPLLSSSLPLLFLSSSSLLLLRILLFLVIIVFPLLFLLCPLLLAPSSRPLLSLFLGVSREVLEADL